MNNFIIIILQLVHSIHASMVIYFKDQSTGTHYPLDIGADATINDIISSSVIAQFDASSIELLFDGQNLLRDDIDALQQLSDLGICAESQLIIGRKRQEMVQLNAVICSQSSEMEMQSQMVPWNCTLRSSMTFDDIKYQFEQQFGYNVRALFIERPHMLEYEPMFTYILSLKNLSLSIAKSRISDAVPPPVMISDLHYPAGWDALTEDRKWWNHEIYDRWPTHPNGSMFALREITSAPPMSEWKTSRYFSLPTERPTQSPTLHPTIPPLKTGQKILSKALRVIPGPNWIKHSLWQRYIPQQQEAHRGLRSIIKEKVMQNEVIAVDKPFSFDDVYFDVEAFIKDKKQRQGICLCDEFTKLPENGIDISSGFPSSWLDSNSSAVVLLEIPWNYTLNAVKTYQPIL